MSEIALYNVLTKLGATPDEAKEAVADVVSSKDVATKTDIVEVKSYISTEIAKLESRVIWRVVIVLGIYTAIISFITKVL